MAADDGRDPGEALDLCPVTEGILKRYLRTVTPRLPSERRRGFETFLSHSSDSLPQALRVKKFLSERLRRKVYFYEERIQEPNFSRDIDDALSECTELVVFATSLQQLARKWVDYEYRTFHVEEMSRRRPGLRIVSVVPGIPEADVPRPLCHYRVIGTRRLDAALAALGKHLGPKKRRTDG